MNTKKVFVTGGTGFMGRRLIEALLERGYTVDALVREKSAAKLPAGCVPVVGDALNADSYRQALTREHVFVQLVGVSHPGPLKKGSFRSIDFIAGREAVKAASGVPVRHFVYLSVAQPAPIMRAYVQVRAEVETLIRASGLGASILRPWYVLGPGRWWPLLFAPLYWIFENRRLRLVTHRQMTAALVRAVENPQPGVRVYEVPEIASPTN